MIISQLLLINSILSSLSQPPSFPPISSFLLPPAPLFTLPQLSLHSLTDVFIHSGVLKSFFNFQDVQSLSDISEQERFPPHNNTVCNVKEDLSSFVL